MDFIDVRLTLPDNRVLYRLMPAVVEKPDPAKLRLERAAFEREPRQKLIGTPGLMNGHRGTDLWYMRQRPDHYYVLHIRLDGGLFRRGRDIFARSICTWTPSQGIDAFDQCLAIDIEDAVLLGELNRPAPRLAIFDDKPAMSVIDYMIARGLLAPDPTGESDGTITSPLYITP